MKYKVLITASTSDHLLRFHLPYMKYFYECGFEIHVACLCAVRKIPYASKIISVPFSKVLYSMSNFLASFVLWKLVRKENYTIIIAHTSLAAFFTRLALCFILHKPKVAVMVHGYLFDRSSFFLRRWLFLTAEMFVANKTDVLIVMNNEDLQIAERYHLGKHIAYVPGIGIDFSRFDCCEQGRIALREHYNIAEHDIVLIYAAEFTARKKQSMLLYAMEKLPPNVILVLAGEGILKERCRLLAQNLGIAQRVLFLGYVKEMTELYRMADIAVTASRYEGLPFNVMESMYFKLPVVASDVKGNRDLVMDGVTGFLYPYGDVKACAEAVGRLCRYEGLRKRMGQQGRNHVMQYDLHHVFPLVIKQYLQAYRTE